MTEHVIGSAPVGRLAADADAELPVPADYRLAVPDGWVRLVLDPAQWDRRVAAIVERQFRGVDNLPQLKAQARERLRKQAETAYANGGVELYLSLMTAGQVVLAAGLLVTLIAERDGVVPPPVQDVALAAAAEGRDVRMIDLQAGPAMRERYLVAPSPDDPDGNTTLPITHLDVQVGIPNTTAHLLLSFSTPVFPLADQMVELFETIAGTLQWVR